MDERSIRYNKFGVNVGEVVIRRPQCSKCAHFHGDMGKPQCDAFNGDRLIPDAILLGSHDHREKYPGDSGIRFKEIKPG